MTKKFQKVADLYWYDGPLVSSLVDEQGEKYIGLSTWTLIKPDGEYTFLVVKAPEGEHSLQVVLHEAKEAWLWEYDYTAWVSATEYPCPITLDLVGEGLMIDSVEDWKPENGHFYVKPS